MSEDVLNEKITDLREQLALSEACNTSLRNQVGMLKDEIAMMRDVFMFVDTTKKRGK